MAGYEAPAHIVAAAKDALLPTHPSIAESYLAERATVVAAFAEAGNLRVVPDDHPVRPSIINGIVPNGCILPPPPCMCAHCGTEVQEGNKAALHTVEGTTLTVTVSHCDSCYRADAACAVRCAPIAQ